MSSTVLPQGALAGALDTICPKSHGKMRLTGTQSLANGRVHEVLGESAMMFALIAASSTKGPIIWIGLHRDLSLLSPLGVQNFIDPSRLILVEGVTRTELLWASEQALRTNGVTAVIIELDRGPGLKESRRLQLAAEESGAVGLILINGRAQTSAAETRWRCNSNYHQKIAWNWECSKHRQGETGAWQVTWLGEKYGPDRIHMAATASA